MVLQKVKLVQWKITLALQKEKKKMFEIPLYNFLEQSLYLS
jgi:hypothetical protein